MVRTSHMYVSVSRVMDGCVLGQDTHLVIVGDLSGVVVDLAAVMLLNMLVVLRNLAKLSLFCRFKPSEGVIVLAATNFPESLDQALIRPGRFDRQVTVPEPRRQRPRADPGSPLPQCPQRSRCQFEGVSPVWNHELLCSSLDCSGMLFEGTEACFSGTMFLQ